MLFYYLILLNTYDYITDCVDLISVTDNPAKDSYAISGYKNQPWKHNLNGTLYD